MQYHYRGYCITKKSNGTYKIEGFSNVFYIKQDAENLIDLLSQGVTKANANCKPFATQKN